jgi:hypothetical protein
LSDSAQRSIEGLLCALVIAPRVYARNRFFELFEQPLLRKIRRRASLLRGIVRQLAAPQGTGGEIIGEQILADGRVLLRYVVPGLNFTRTTALTNLEAAIIRYLVARAKSQPCQAEDYERIELALAGLAGGLPRPTIEREPGHDNTPNRS